MYKRSWIAYPVGRLTLTCPMPTRHLPLMARTHEDQHTFTLLSSLPSYTSVTRHLPYPSSLHSHPPLNHKDVRRKREVWGERRVGHSFSSPSSFTLLKEKNSPSLPLRLLPCLVFLPLLSLLFLAVTLWASICHCYIQGCLLHESKWLWGTNGGVKVGMRRS